MPNLSIIIPVYNTAEFLPTCLDSVLSLSSLDLEVIVVNDGSTDNSLSIITHYANNDSRIKYISQKNFGLSAARNAGMNVATGDYVLFVDSDDWIFPNTIAHYWQRIKESNTDVVAGIVGIAYEDGHMGVWDYATKLHAEHPIVSGEEYLGLILSCGHFTPMAYNYFCRRDWLINEGLFFEPGIIHEDELWTPNLLMKAKTITFGTVPHYAYRRRTSGSITSSSTSFTRLQSLIKIVGILSATYSTLQPGTNSQKFFIYQIRAIFRTCAQITLRDNTESKFLFEDWVTELPKPIEADPIILTTLNKYYSIKEQQNKVLVSQ